MTEAIILACWSCGTKQGVEVSQKPYFAYELALIARDVGWVGVLDPAHSRSLVFCSDECLQKQLKKDGTIRKYAKR